MVSATTIAAVVTISNVVDATITPRRLPSTVPLQLGFYRMLGTCAEIPTLAGFMMTVKAPKIGIQVDLRFEDYDGQVLFVSNYYLAPISMPVGPGEGRTDVGEQTAAIVFDHRIEGRSTVRGFELTNYVAAQIIRVGDVDEHTYARSYRDCYTLGERHGSDRLQSDASSIPASQDQSKVPARICAESKDLISLIYGKDDATETKVYLVRESTNLALLPDTAARRGDAPSLI
ncbi:hypothetical protein FOZ60_016337 [Perkinsus olseni]|uniref:Uncharacterized protein n=1 Tax=Perkinsus olseni TaxID=32597 RepID=A0A7J6N564_PEROL|nr:hypothetical protein FOZ60_016337 [Perkinsus olseni]